MTTLLKICFYVPFLINCLIGGFYFLMTLGGMLAGYAYPRTNDGIVLLGCATVLALLGWTYQLAIVQERTLAGFGVLGLSYLAWLGILGAILLFGKVHWQ